MHATRPTRLTRDSRLSGTILRMISSNSLAAFTQDVSRAAGIGEVRPVRAAAGGSERSAAPPQRALDCRCVSPFGSAPTPRLTSFWLFCETPASKSMFLGSMAICAASSS